MQKASVYPLVLLIFYILWAALWGISPASRAVWWAENLPLFLLVSGLGLLHLRGVRFSNLAWSLMAVLPILHTVGGHYTFEKVPFDWFNRLLGTERNMFDRVAHTTVGFYAFAMIEWMERRSAFRFRWLGFAFALFAVAFIAVFYEWVEWIYAVTQDPGAGIAFLGSQGDVWDAQKDMLCDVTGAALSLLLYAVVRRNEPAPDALAPGRP